MALYSKNASDVPDTQSAAAQIQSAWSGFVELSGFQEKWIANELIQA